MTEHPAPHLARTRKIPLIWLVPLIALLAAAWMLFAEYREHGPEIVVDFADGSGIEPRKTSVDFKGVSVGVVRAVSLKPDLSGVSVHVRLTRGAASLAAEGAQFWVVQPEISFGAVRGLDTILRGSRINVLPGRGEPADRFVGLDRAPPPRGREGGRSFVLDGERLGSINAGSPVFYRDVKVGVVEGTRLAPDSASVRMRVRIEAPYVDLVRTNTRFWNAGGLDFKLSLFGGGHLRNTSLESLINGGVAFATPDTSPLAPPASEGSEFQLTSEADKAWLTWRPQISIQPADAPVNESSAAGVAPLLVTPETRSTAP